MCNYTRIKFGSHCLMMTHSSSFRQYINAGINTVVPAIPIVSAFRPFWLWSLSGFPVVPAVLSFRSSDTKEILKGKAPWTLNIRHLLHPPPFSLYTTFTYTVLSDRLVGGSRVGSFGAPAILYHLLKGHHHAKQKRFNELTNFYDFNWSSYLMRIFLLC